MTQESPLYIQVRDSIKHEIESGAVCADDKGILPGQATFAAKYNVSLATVSRAISDLEKMGLVESRRGRGLVIKTKDGSGRPQIPAENRVLHIGIALVDALEDFTRPFSGQVLSGINDAAKGHQISTHIVSFPGQDAPIQQDAFFANFPFDGIDGIILLSPVSARSIAHLIEREIPYVSGVSLSDANVIVHVPDKYTAIHRLVSTVLKKRPNIPPLIFVGNINNVSCYTLCSAYKIALEVHGLAYDPRYISYEHYDLQRAKEAVQNLIASGAPLESIIARDDYMASSLIDLTTSMGRGDILVASEGIFPGYENKIRITTDNRLREIGFNLMNSLIEIVNGEYTSEARKFYYESVIVDRCSAEE